MDLLARGLVMDGAIKALLGHSMVILAVNLFLFQFLSHNLTL